MLIICLMQVTHEIMCVIMVTTQTKMISITLARIHLPKYPLLRCRMITSWVMSTDELVKESPLIDMVPCPIFSIL